MKTFRLLLATALVVAIGWAADMGPLFQRNLSGTPELHTEQAAIAVMPLYVPAQDTQGEPPATASGEIEYYAGDCTNHDTSTCDLVYTRPETKPLVATYLDGEVEFIEGLNFTGHGRRDAYVALSLDDGATWRKVNVSGSGDLSSFTLADGADYPGDVFGVSTAVVGNRVLVAWMSRFCASGDPLYSREPEDQLLLASTYALGTNLTVDGVEYNTYASDLFGVSGTQKSSDFTDEGYPQVGEVPYACLWTARGMLEQARDDVTGERLANSNGDPVYQIAWRAAERLTSGLRDVNLVQAAGTSGAGFVVIWQEDPLGLRPGQALCLDGGFNGAVAHPSTDIWYSHISWDHFDDVCLDEPDGGLCTGGTYEEFVDTGLYGQKPKTAVPMAVPMRLTDNELCRAGVTPETQGYRPYCYADFNGNGAADFCAESVSWTNPGGTTLDVCVAEDGRVLTGRTAATRPRFDLKPYTTSDGAVSAWVLVIHEGNKAMGTELDAELEPVDIGKDVWYHTFELTNPELVQQGLMINAPAIDPETGEPFFPYYVDEWGYEYLETEIARHAELAAQGIGAAMAGPSNTSAILIYKQGILNQGGPADIFMRRLVLPGDFNPAVDNPFAYENVQCVEFDDAGSATPVEWLYADGSNPNYVRGLCPVEGMNLSGTSIVACDGVPGDCADAFPWDPDALDSAYPKVTEWVQTVENFNDPSWANPYDVSRDHRGFIDGDFVTVLYTTAPNWKASTIGREAYNLYARRSFDGGQSWTTLPADYTHADGTTWSGDGIETCEWYGWGARWNTRSAPAMAPETSSRRVTCRS